jgi:hypothetical protein
MVEVIWGRKRHHWLYDSRVRRDCRAEIERAIDEVKRGVVPAKTRTAEDRSFRRQWYRNQWRMRQVNGPTVTRE